jgi:hypothetical protein
MYWCIFYFLIFNKTNICGFVKYCLILIKCRKFFMVQRFLVIYVKSRGSIRGRLFLLFRRTVRNLRQGEEVQVLLLLAPIYCTRGGGQGERSAYRALAQTQTQTHARKG